MRGPVSIRCFRCIAGAIENMNTIDQTSNLRIFFIMLHPLLLITHIFLIGAISGLQSPNPVSSDLFFTI